MLYPFLEAPSIQFPPTSKALSDPNGLLAVGGELSPEFLLTAYCRGIFPWFSEGEEVHWWSPTPRMVLYPSEVHCSKSMTKHINKMRWTIKVNSRFEDIINACADTRLNAQGTWITQAIRKAYIELHHQGYAHSIEVFDHDELVGGLYGIGLGQVFFGESMFSYRPNASKTAFIHLARWLQQRDFPMIDCQVRNPHLVSLGAREIDRFTFETTLTQFITPSLISQSKTDWQKATNQVICANGHLNT